tara:strand:+ start:483 stop:689 length:207 start_codon:yes stop_codon:yes gene_type:complete
MFEAGDLISDKRYPKRYGYIFEVLRGKNSKQIYLEVRWLNFPWGNPHTKTLEIPKDLVIASKVRPNER